MGVSGDGTMSTDGKPKIDVKDDSGATTEPHKPKVTSSTFFLIYSFFCFSIFLLKERPSSPYAASAHCFPVVFSPYLMICLTFTIPNVFLDLFLPPALFSLADVLVVGKKKKKKRTKKRRGTAKARARHLTRAHVKFIFDTEIERARMSAGSFCLSWRQ